MKLKEMTIRLDRTETGNTVTGEGAALTCYIKDNTKGRPDSRRPAVIICPGGGYEYCSTREAEPVAMQFLAMDCQAFVLRYSTQTGCFPKALLELAETVSLLRENAEEWHIDDKKIIVCGFSAGGHLAASLGVFWNREFLTKPLNRSAGRLRPDGLILAYPVISSGDFAHKGSFLHLLGEQGNTQLYSGSQDTVQEALALAYRECRGELSGLVSLELQAGAQVPPVFMWHTDTDTTVPVENSLLFATALKKAKVSLELHIYPEGRHGLALATEETDKEEDDGRGPNVVSCCQSWIGLSKEWLHTLFH